MKAPNNESRELLLMTGILVALTLVAILINHKRAEFMIVLTLIMAVMAFLARFRRRRREQVKTLPAKGRRKAAKTQH